MANYIATDTDLTAVADAIRAKGGTSGTLEFPDEFVSAIGSISNVNNQDKSRSYTPTESAQSETITADSGYTGLGEVSVSVGAIASDYVGSGITRRSSSDMTASGATVTAPAGYYSSSSTKSVTSGTAGTPSATKSAVSNHSVTVTPSVTNTTGYITGGTKTGTAVTVSASELVSGTKTITSSGNTDVTNYATASVAAGSATTPSTSITANPTLYVSNAGLVSAAVSKSQNITPTVSAGWVSSGTAGSVSIDGLATQQLSTQAATTFHPSTTDQTIASGKYTTGTQTIKAVTTTNLTAENIVSGVTVKVGDSTDDDCVASVTGTAQGGTLSGLVWQDNEGYIHFDDEGGDMYIATPLNVTTNGTYTAPTGVAYTPVSVQVSSSPTLQAKTNISPTTSSQTITADTGYDGLSSVQINAMPSGSATTPATTVTANPSISVNSSGLITATASATKSVTPTVSAGYVSSGTAGTITVSGSNTSQLTTQAAQTIHPSSSDQTITSGKYLTGTQTIKGVTATNLSAGNIKSGVTVEIGDSTDSDCVTSVTGTYTGGGGGAEEKQVNFIDYDGTILYSYTATEAQALTELPANPTHTGLTAQGWNWTLAEIKAHLTSYTHSIVDVGQMYTTTSGATEIDVTLLPDSLSPTLRLLLNNATVEVDWGDSSARDTITGNTTIDQSHTYSTQGTYTIKIYLISGQIRLYCSNQTTARPFLLDTNFPNSNRYTNGITAVRVGSGDIQLDQYSFNFLLNLEYVTIPNTINSLLGGYVFYGCNKLKSVTIPRCVNNLGQYFFYDCRLLKHACLSGNIKQINSYPFLYTANLKHVCLPDSITTITNNTFNSANVEITNVPSQATLSSNMFREAYALVTVDGLQNMTSLLNYMFYGCYSLRGLVIPSVTSIPNYAFSDARCAFEEVVVPSTVTSIGQYAFQNIYTLRKITLPSGLATINTYAFSGCNTLLEIHMLSTTPPTLSGTGWFPSCATIYVPYSSDHSVLNTYKTAQNWSNFQSMIAEESP